MIATDYTLDEDFKVLEDGDVNTQYYRAVLLYRKQKAFLPTSAIEVGSITQSIINKLMLADLQEFTTPHPSSVYIRDFSICDSPKGQILDSNFAKQVLSKYSKTKVETIYACPTTLLNSNVEPNNQEIAINNYSGFLSNLGFSSIAKVIIEGYPAPVVLMGLDNK